MSRTYKWLGGIGYIFALIPYINFIGMILVAIAWIMMGGETRQGIFKATGVFIILSMILSVVMMVAFPLGIPGMFGGLTARPPPIGALQFVGTMIAVMAIMMVIGLVTFILELVSHFRAAGIYYIKWFRYAGWMRIITVIVAVIGTVVMFASIPGIFAGAPPSGIGPGFFGILMNILWPMIIAVVFALIAVIFSIIAFFSIPSTPAYQPAPSYQPSPYQPPPPPPTYSSRG